MKLHYQLLSFIYKIVSLLIGFACLFMGYKLFMGGIAAKTGEIVTNVKDVSFTFKEAAPGTFFCVLGACIVIVTILKGRSYKEENIIKKNDGQERHVFIQGDDYHNDSIT